MTLTQKLIQFSRSDVFSLASQTADAISSKYFETFNFAKSFIYGSGWNGEFMFFNR